jgi:protein SCO1/2
MNSGFWILDFGLNHTRRVFHAGGLSFSIRCALCALGVSCAAQAQLPPPQMPDELPKELEGVGIFEKLNQTAPLDVPFKDENGKDVTIRDYLQPGKPVILTPVYYQCPMLCNYTLNGLVGGLNDVDLTAGKDFTIVTFSFNPAEQPKLAEVKKRAYLTQYRRETAKEGWHFLTGSEEHIKQMCDGIGFGFKPDGEGDFAHTSTIVFLTPEGVIARYFNDVVFQGRDLRFALVESSQGKIGSAMDKFLVFMCYQYDPLKNSYAASAMKIMRLGGLVTVVLVAAGLGLLWMRSPRHAVADRARATGAEGRVHLQTECDTQEATR